MNEIRKPIVVGLGEILWDMLPTGKKAGGAPINFVYHACQMGAVGYAVSAIGKDKDGDEILQELEKNNINHLITRVDKPTGKVLVKLKEGIPSYDIVEGVAWDFIPLTQEAEEMVQKADAICFGTLASRNEYSRQTIVSLLNQASDNALKFFDINLRSHYYSPELIRQFLHLADIFKINEDEMKVLCEIFNLSGNDREIYLNLIEQYNLKYLIFTAGDKYSIIYSPSEISYLDTPKVKVADTVGAGDAFSGAFVYDILMGKNLKEAHNDAVKISAFVCTKEGAWPQYTPDMKG